MERVGEAQALVEGARDIEVAGGEQQQVAGDDVGQHAAREPVHRHSDRAAEQVAPAEPVEDPQ